MGRGQTRILEWDAFGVLISPHATTGVVVLENASTLDAVLPRDFGSE